MHDVDGDVVGAMHRLGCSAGEATEREGRMDERRNIKENDRNGGGREAGWEGEWKEGVRERMTVKQED